MDDKILFSVLHLQEASRLTKYSLPDLSLAILNVAKFLIDTYEVTDALLSAIKSEVEDILLNDEK